jgi:hypothetical protein
MTFSNVDAARPKLAGDLSRGRKHGQRNDKRNRVIANDTLRNALLVAAATLLAYLLTYPVGQ